LTQKPANTMWNPALRRIPCGSVYIRGIDCTERKNAVTKIEKPHRCSKFSSKLIYCLCIVFLSMEQSAKNSSVTIADLPRQIRVSVGSAIVLGLLEGKLDVAPTTAYLMTYKMGKCTANCLFCPQARNSRSKADLLSRVSWPVFDTERVLKKIRGVSETQQVKRVCVQALNYPEVFVHLVALVTELKRRSTVPVSVSCQPQNSGDTRCLREAGADRIGIALDAATERLFNQVKGADANGPYVWDKRFRQLSEAVEIFGKRNVSTHLIIGLGETENDAASLIQRCVDMDVSPALFAFTPIRGTPLETKPQPKIETYRRIQLARYLIVNGHARSEDMHFDSAGCLTEFGVEKETLTWIVETGTPFLTSGCPHCNRPFYNEKPSGPIYNYPRKPSWKEILAIKRQLSLET
jgi:biotin synthase-related radical SAM superfamily protein